MDGWKERLRKTIAKYIPGYINFYIEVFGGAALGRRSRLIEKVQAINKRLDKVLIENKSYEEIISLYDHKENFFYCDPPYYHGATYDNSKKFDHIKLRDMLSKIEGRFLLSYDNTPEIKELYKNFNIVELVRQKGINRMVGKSEYEKVLIANYELKFEEQIEMEWYSL